MKLFDCVDCPCQKLSVVFDRREMLAVGVFSWLSGLLKPALAEKQKFEDINQFRDFVIMRHRLHYTNATDVKLDQTDPAIFTITINGNDVKSDVTNLFGYVRSYPDEDVTALVDRHVRSASFDHSADELNIVAVVRTIEYIEYSKEQTIDLVYEPLVGDLHIVYMIDSTDAMSPIGSDQMLGKGLLELRELALTNARKWLPKLKKDESIGPIALYYVEGNELLSTGLILEKEFWSMISKSEADKFYFAIPRRDQLFILDYKNSNAFTALRKLVEVTIEDGFNLLSPNIYLYRAGKFEVVLN